MAWALAAFGRHSKIVRIYQTPEDCANAARPGCFIVQVPDELLPPTFVWRSHVSGTNPIVEYVSNLPTEERIMV